MYYKIGLCNVTEFLSFFFSKLGYFQSGILAFRFAYSWEKDTQKLCWNSATKVWIKILALIGNHEISCLNTFKSGFGNSTIII